MTIADEAEAAAALWGGKIVRLIKHRENAVFEMALPQGRAALRLHRMGYQSAVAIRSELWWAGALADAGIAVPAPQAALSGETLVTLTNGRHCSAIAWVAGQPLGEAGVPYTDDLETLTARHRALGKLMAQVHAATAQLTLPDWFTRSHWDADGLTGDDPFWGRFWEHPLLTKPEATALIAARDYLRGWLQALPAPDLGPIHADVLRENVLVDGSRLSLIDFDDSGIGYRLYDLGTTMSQNIDEPHYAAIRDALISGYGQATIAEVEHFTLARTMVSVGWTAPRVPLDDPVHRRHIDRALRWSRHVTARA
jgi:Ser/Thr protein kinase RdoA (MazF antagonist)